jgi:DNA-binding transcriptional ArsR family regulator
VDRVSCTLNHGENICKEVLQRYSAIVTERKYDAPALGGAALKVLGHPLRLRLYWALTKDGPATATQLAAVTHESTGDTSYHLRQLARHGVIEDAVGLGTGRERWWKATGFSIDSAAHRSDPEAASAVALLLDETARQRVLALAEWADQAARESDDWIAASISTTEFLEVAPESLHSMVTEIREVISRYQTAPTQTGGEVRPVVVYFDAFPVRPGRSPERSGLEQAANIIGGQ